MKKNAQKEVVEVVFDDPSKIDGPYLSFWDNAKKRFMYTPTTEKMFHDVRNINRDMQRREQKDIYYDVLYEDRGWVRQKHKPTDKDGYYLDYKVVPPASLDYLHDEYDLEFAAPEEKPTFGVPTGLIMNELAKILSKLDETDRKIFELSYFQKKTDGEIALIVFNGKKDRTGVCRQREEVRYFVECHLRVFINKSR